MSSGRPAPGRGLFIAIEGGDGAGKGSLIAAVASWFAAEGWPSTVTREPGGTPEGEALRALLLAYDSAAWDARAELLLMTAARIQHIRTVIGPALTRGDIVLCDRYVGSTLAYQGAGRGLPESLIRGLHRDAAGDLWPDLTVVLDIDPAVGIARAKGRLATAGVDEARFEGLDLAFHRRVRASYLAQAQASPDRFGVIDAAQPLEAAHADAFAMLRPVLARAGRRPTT